MPRSQRSFDRMIIPAPCDADWDAMIGNERVRFCEHCNLHVRNISALTKSEAMRLVARSEGRLCVRFVKRGDGSFLTKQVPQALHQISRRVSRIAAGAFTATLSLSSAVAQTGTESNSSVPVQTRAIDQATARTTATSTTGKVFGTVLDATGAVIPGATIELVSSDTADARKATSSDEGQYLFDHVLPGTYTVKASAPGFATLALEEFRIAVDESKSQDLQLEVGAVFATSGVVAMAEPEDPFIKAVSQNDLNAVVELLFMTADINASDKVTDTTALAYAIENNNLDMVRVLISAGAMPNGVNRKGETPLMYLTSDASVEFLKQLIAIGVDVKARDDSGRTVLMNAARHCNFALVKDLVDAGATIDVRDNDGNTVLMSAAENADAEITRFLIQRGVPLDYKNDDGESAILVALKSGRSENFMALIHAGASLSLAKEDLDDALLDAARNGDPLTTKFLLEKGADANAKDDDTTVLMLAAENGSPEMVKTLIDAGADVNAVDEQGWTAMMHANEAENVRVLLNAGADSSIKNKDGETALAMATRYEQAAVVQLLKSRAAPHR